MPDDEGLTEVYIAPERSATADVYRDLRAAGGWLSGEVLADTYGKDRAWRALRRLLAQGLAERRYPCDREGYRVAGYYLWRLTQQGRCTAPATMGAPACAFRVLRDSGEALPVATLARRCGYTERAIRYAMHTLHADGVVERSKRGCVPYWRAL